MSPSGVDMCNNRTTEMMSGSCQWCKIIKLCLSMPKQARYTKHAMPVLSTVDAKQPFKNAMHVPDGKSQQTSTICLKYSINNTHR